MKGELAVAYSCAATVALAVLTVPFWLLSGLAEAVGLAVLGGVAAIAGVGLGLGVRAGLRGERRGAGAAALNGALLVLVTAGLWMWGRYLAEPPCPTC